jgi:uncharacterized protein GlcG (DUF336 family)
MRNLIAFSVSMLALSAAVQGQGPAAAVATSGAATAAMPPPPALAPPYGPPITLAQAKQLAALVTAEAGRSNADRYVLAIVQPSGDLVYFEKADNSTYVSIQYAQAKARMAARYRTASGNLPPNAGDLPDAISLTGGMPIVFQGKTIGAIGISGVGGGGDVKLSEMAATALSK